MNKWEVDEHKQWSEKVRSHRFCPPLLDKNGNYEGMWSNKRKSFVKPVGMNGSNFKNETLFVSYTATISHYYQKWDSWPCSLILPNQSKIFLNQSDPESGSHRLLVNGRIFLKQWISLAIQSCVTISCLEITSSRIRSQTHRVLDVYIICVYSFTLPLILQKHFKDAVDNVLKGFVVVMNVNEHESPVSFDLAPRHFRYILPAGFGKSLIFQLLSPALCRKLHTMGYENQFSDERNS